MDNTKREWSSSQLMISTSVPSRNCQWVKSPCQVSLGWSATKRQRCRYEQGRDSYLN
jgi:hypothetical protein